MYGFRLTLLNIETNETKTKLIEVERQLFDTEEAVFLHAMKEAYKLASSENVWTFDKLEFLYA